MVATAPWESPLRGVAGRSSPHSRVGARRPRADCIDGTRAGPRAGLVSHHPSLELGGSNAYHILAALAAGSLLLAGRPRPRSSTMAPSSPAPPNPPNTSAAPAPPTSASIRRPRPSAGPWTIRPHRPGHHGPFPRSARSARRRASGRLPTPPAGRRLGDTHRGSNRDLRSGKWYVNVHTAATRRRNPRPGRPRQIAPLRLFDPRMSRMSGRSDYKLAILSRNICAIGVICG